MKPKDFFHSVGWGIAIAALILTVFEAGQITWERWLERKEQINRKAIETAFDRRIFVFPPKSQPLPPDYAVFVLCYHDFSDNPQKWSITPQRLEAHLQTLKALGFTFLTVSEAVDLLSGRWRNSLPKRAVVITVDDGFQSAYTVLFPLLKRYGAKATLFVYTDWVGKRRGALTWEQLREMVQSGLVEVASHTVTHPYPRRLKRSLSYQQYRNRIKWELEQSKKELEQRLGIKVSGVAYPGGQVDGTMKSLAKRAGYLWAAVINPEPMTVGFDRYAIPRYGVSSDTTVAMLKTWVTKQPIQLARFGGRGKKATKTGEADAISVNLPSMARNSRR
ncbi:MAG: polysaccharide deacetylase family protein [Armatimonadetes bacterium]|nr:polysaccharide deacetylase family protein [Armatimonadota bacterium]MCX7969413.1 polysaccharide deacetylase family protein [Armatimonadota bacterium]MDW8141962.1 polysaccharide deacetylase family protein [Armatimonadota bacterium]